jgi:hypothetical protein
VRAQAPTTQVAKAHGSTHTRLVRPSKSPDGRTPFAAASSASTRVHRSQKGAAMKKDIQDNKSIVGRWFKEFWGNPWNPKCN